VQLKFTQKLKGLSKRQRRTFATVCAAGFFNNYDGALLSLALEQIQRGLKISEAMLPRMASLITLGCLFAPLITSQADRRGRRNLLLVTIALFSLLSGLTAFAWNAPSFVVLKFLTVTFSAAEGSIAMVMLVEEVNADVRGLAVGLLGAISAGGFGLAALGFAVIRVFPFGWRGLFAIAFIPLLLIVPLWRLLPESSRYESTVKAMGRSGFFDPFRMLYRSYPGRFIMVAAVMFLNAMGGTPGGLLQSKYMQEVHGWTPANVSTLILTGGAIGILGNVVAGNLSDQIGRRLLGVITLIVAPIMWTVFFNSAGNIMVASWVLSLFAQTAASTILNAYSAELFPTSHRSTAESAIAVAATLGGSAGLILESWIYGRIGNHWRAVSLLMLASVAAAITVAIFFPETASAELDSISPERSLLSPRHPSRRRPKRAAA
jgi:MFS transporter, putative metabolite:H+ symporter